MASRHDEKHYAEFDKNPHEYVESGDGIWTEHRCAICFDDRVYHYTKKQRRREKFLTFLVIFAIIATITLTMWGLRALFYDGTPQLSEHQKCIRDDGTWARGYDDYQSYCILDGRVK